MMTPDDDILDEPKPSDEAGATWTDENGHVWRLMPNGEPFSLDAAVARLPLLPNIPKEEEEKRLLFEAFWEADQEIEAERNANPNPIEGGRFHFGTPKPPKPPRDVTALEVATRALVAQILQRAREAGDAEPDVEDLIVQYLEQNEGYKWWVYDFVLTYPSGTVTHTTQPFTIEMPPEDIERMRADYAEKGYQFEVVFLGHDFNIAWLDY